MGSRSGFPAIERRDNTVVPFRAAVTGFVTATTLLSYCYFIFQSIPGASDFGVIFPIA